MGRGAGYRIEAVPRSRGGRTSKIHALANHQSKPLALVLTPSSLTDISVAATLFDDVVPPEGLFADKACDADHRRKPLEALGTEIVIPSNHTRRRPHPFNRVASRRRNVIERMFCRMKDWRRTATRYDRLARNFFSATALVATICFRLT